MNPDVLRLKLVGVALAIEAQGQGIDEYPADWLEGEQTILRDAFGRFASVGQYILDSGNAIPMLGDLFQARIVTDPEGSKQAVEQVFGETGDAAREWDSLGWKGLGEIFQNAYQATPLPDLWERAQGIAEAIGNSPPAQVAQSLAQFTSDLCGRYQQAIDNLWNLNSENALLNGIGKIAAIGMTIGSFFATMYIPDFMAVWLLARILGPVIGVGTGLEFLGFIFQASITFGTFGFEILRTAGEILDAIRNDREVQWFDTIGSLVAGAGLSFLGMKLVKQITKGLEPFIKKAESATIGRVKRLQLGNRIETLLPAKEKELKKVISKYNKATSKYRGPFLPSPIGKHVDTRIDKRINAARRQFDDPEEFDQLLHAADTNLNLQFGKANPYVRVPSNKVPLIFQSRLKNSFDLNPEGTGLQVAKRLRVENKLYGTPIKGFPSSQRCTYGYYARPDHINSQEGTYSSWFGDVALELKPEAKQFSTMTPNDSFLAYNNNRLATRGDQISAVAFLKGNENANLIRDRFMQLATADDLNAIRKLVGKDTGVDEFARFFEINMHRPVTFKNVKAMHLTTITQAELNEIASALRRNKFDVTRTITELNKAIKDKKIDIPEDFKEYIPLLLMGRAAGVDVKATP